MGCPASCFPDSPFSSRPWIPCTVPGFHGVGQRSVLHRVGGEVVGQEVRSGQARVLVEGLLCDLKAHGGVGNSL